MKHPILLLTAILTFPLCAFAADPANKDADNTAKNERDKGGKAITPADQSNKSADIKLTQAIRKAVMKDDSLTATAKNVKIITAAGKVTLRGPVTTADEKAKIEAHAKAAAGTVPVDSQIEIKAGK